MDAVNDHTPDRPLSIRVERSEGGAVVTLGGACTMDVSSQIRHCLVGLATEKVSLIVIDMTDLDFIDSVGLGGLVSAHLKIRRNDGTIHLVNPQPSIRDMLELTRLTHLFPIHDRVCDVLGPASA